MKNEFTPRLKYYHIILISIILCPILIINSNNVNNKRTQEVQLKNENKIVEKIFLRKLDFTSETNEICEKGSEELKNYYSTGNEEDIGIKEDKIKNENNESYITALINIISGEGDVTENAKEYVMHIIPVLVILVLAILTIPIWIIFCSCSCCNCCCCCCCRKSICKIPFFIISSVIYAFVFAISIYGLSQSNSIFVGLADTECSILKFIDQILNGENKKGSQPYWAGIDNIQNIFRTTEDNIDSLQGSYQADLLSARNNFGNAKGNFQQALQEQSTNVANSVYSKTIDTKSYKLDIIQEFGRYTKPNEQGNPEYCFVDRWLKESKNTEVEANSIMGQIDTEFTSALNGENNPKGALEEGITSIGTIKSSIDGVKEQISNIILTYSDTIDKYGKLSFKIVFSILMVFDAGIAALMTVMTFFSFSCFDKCCCCFRCFFKALIHILWNILALLTIFTFIIGFLCALIGTLGKDLVSVVSFLVSEDNLKGQEPILFSDNDASIMINKCINDNGDIKDELGLDNPALNAIQSLRDLKERLIAIKSNFNNYLSQKPVYNDYLKKFEERRDYKTTNFELQSESDSLNFGDYLNNLNDLIRVKNEEWKITCEPGTSHSCDSVDTSTHSYYCINPSSCQSGTPGSWYGSDSPIHSITEILDFFITSILKSNSEEDYSIKKALSALNTAYENFLRAETGSLDIYISTVEQLTSIFENIAGDDGNIYSILNCKFIGKNVRVLLKYLDKSLGKSFYNVGITLSVAGIGLLVSISFTILLNVIINTKSGK